jgi:hypothetical protein
LLKFGGGPLCENPSYDGCLFKLPKLVEGGGPFWLYSNDGGLLVGPKLDEGGGPKFDDDDGPFEPNSRDGWNLLDEPEYADGGSFGPYVSNEEAAPVDGNPRYSFLKYF